LYAAKFGVDKTKMASRLWGDNYFDAEAKKWTTNSTSASGKPLQRAFCKFILEPIYQIFKVYKGLSIKAAILIFPIGLHE
jgi:elongation factor 2